MCPTFAALILATGYDRCTVAKLKGDVAALIAANR